MFRSITFVRIIEPIRAVIVQNTTPKMMVFFLVFLRAISYGKKASPSRGRGGLGWKRLSSLLIVGRGGVTSVPGDGIGMTGQIHLVVASGPAVIASFGGVEALRLVKTS